MYVWVWPVPLPSMRDAFLMLPFPGAHNDKFKASMSITGMRRGRRVLEIAMLCWILENDPSPLDPSFSVEEYEVRKGELFISSISCTVWR